MRRADLADLTAFVAVADNLSFRAVAPRGGSAQFRVGINTILELPH